MREYYFFFYTEETVLGTEGCLISWNAIGGHSLRGYVVRTNAVGGHHSSKFYKYIG